MWEGGEMSPARPFRFGVQASAASNRSAWVELARRVEGCGFSTLTMPDHFGDQLAPGPALMAAADATTTLRVGALVLDNDFRHPVVLAKELATIDLLSDGRLEVGLGAGWMRTDYDASGLPYDEARVRIERMVESLAILKALFSDGPASFSGKHYSVEGLEGWPKPVQRPGPPLLLGGGGRRVLSIAAREADIVGINGTLTTGVIGAEALASMTAPAVDTKIGWVREAAGSRVDDIELNIRAFFVSVTNDRAATADAVASGLRLDPAEVLDSPFALIGTAEQIAETLMARRERWGLSYVIVGPEGVDAFAPIVSQLTGR
jgi:probable F420-dependent oxidoreductase